MAIIWLRLHRYNILKFRQWAQTLVRRVELNAEVGFQGIEIVSKVLFRHANLSTTQRYLGTIGDVEAIQWIENIYQ